MSDETEPTLAGVPRRQLWSMGVLTVLALALFTVMLLAYEPTVVMWVFAGLMLAAAGTFWGFILRAYRRNRSAE